MIATKTDPFVFDSRYKESRDYWIKKLYRETQASGLVLDYPRPAVYLANTDSVEIRVQADSRKALAALTGNSPFLLYATLLSTLTVCLYRYTGSQIISIGSPTTRVDHEAENPNVLVVVSEVDHRLSFRQLLLNVRQTLLEAYANQDYPLARLMDDLGVEHLENQSSLFDVVLRLADIHADLPELKHDLTVTFSSSSNELTGVIEFNSSLFKRESIERFRNHFLNILDEAVKDPGRQIYEFNMLTALENHWQSERNETKADYPDDTCIHQLFEKQAALTPEAIAVIRGQEQVSYRELNRRANQLAHQLKAAGVVPETLVGICVDRSVEMVVGLLGILKAGGAYLPLDPALPKVRLSHMINDSGLSLLLTEKRLVGALGETSARIIYFDEVPDDAAAEQETISTVASANLAYMIYTSGSTGKPKGVLITHQGLVNYCHCAAKHYGLTHEDRVLQFASLSFDVCAEELFPTWISGATVVLRNNELVPSGDDILNLVVSQHVSVLNLPSSYWREIVNELLSARKKMGDSLRLMVVGSEQVLSETYAAWLKIGGGAIALINAYGPTETTIAATLYKVSADLEALENRTHLPIGRPLANTQIHLLDGGFRLVPEGVTAELHIAGHGLGRGYFNSPDLTAERYLPNPFGQAGTRLYKTGDLARYLPNGLIEFRGRMDHQVKVRGYRIELGEIEAVLSQHPSIGEVVVQGTEDEVGNNRLVAYLIAAPGQTPTISVLQSYVREKLPHYMVPAAFELLESFPLTRSGKVDRNAFPAPTWALFAGRNYVGSRTPNEAVLAGIWSQVLGLEKVGVHDNFFELGGDSIISIQIIARANQAGLHLTAKQLFQHQTIAELAVVASTKARVEAEQGIVEGPVRLTPVQHWFFEQELEEAHHWNNALMLEFEEGAEGGMLRRAVGEIVKHHDALRLRFRKETGGWEQRNQGIEEIAYTEVELGEVGGGERGAALAEAARQMQGSLNLSEGPIVRVGYFGMGAGERKQLLMVMHHLVIDAVSWRILLEDLGIAYEQLRQGREIELAAKTSSFQSWAGRLSEYAQSEAAGAEESYWEGVKSDERRLPVDLEGGENLVGSVETLVVSLSVEETRGLLQEAPGAYRTQINDLLLTALVKAVGEWTGSESLLIEVEGHGREELMEDLDISRTVGWFTSIYPVRLEVRGTRTVGEAVKRVKEQLRGIPKKGIGYGVLRYLREGGSEAGKGAGAGAEVSFNYLGQFDQAVGVESAYRLVNEPSGELQSRRGQRPYLLDVSGSIVGGQLHVVWTYSGAVHKSETIERVAADYVEQLRAIISHCQDPEAGGYTPSDFPLAQLNQGEIDRLLGTNRNVEDVYPLSPMQEGMLFHTLYAPKSRAYFEQLSFPMHLELDVPAFEAAWQRVMDKHSMLRTSFVWKGLLQPLQIVHKRLKLPFEQYDWRHLSETEQRKQLKAHLRSDLIQAFDLSVAPLIRLSARRLGQSIYQVTISNHHTLLDAWSMPLIWEEVLAFYEAFSANRDLPFQKGLPFRNYISWLKEQDMAKAEMFWRQTLKGFTRATSLPEKNLVGAASDFPESGRPQEHLREVQLPEQTTLALQAMARQNRLTINTLAQGAWSVLLSRYSGAEDVLFGGTVSGRSPTLAGVESMVGLFINTLPIRVQVSPKSATVDWLKQIQNDQIEARQYEFSPLEQIQKWSEIARGKPLFESIMIFHSMTHKAVQQTAGAPVEGVHIFQLATYPLGIVVASGSQMLFRIGYEPSRFDAVTITRMHQHFQALLEGMIANPRQRVSDLPLLRAAEKRQLEAGTLNREAALAKSICIHKSFEEQVQRTPDAWAIAFEAHQLTYSDLNARANKLAHYLRSCNAKPEVRVGILLDDSVEMLVALLGILKTGAAYVPLDTDHPHLAMILADAHLSLLVTTSSLRSDFSAYSESVVCLDSEWLAIANQSDENPESGVTEDNLAYVMYVPGSRGAPDGLMVTHYALARYSDTVSENYHIRSDDRVLQSAPIVSHQSVSEIFPCLTSGATLVQRSVSGLDSSDQFLRQCDDRSTTIVNLPSMYWNEVRTTLGTEVFSIPASIRLLITKCDGLLQEQLVHWCEQQGRDLRLMNTWATTEDMAAATMCDQAETVNAAGAQQASLIEPLNNGVRTYVLDKYMQPVPIGVAGNLYIGGFGLARGFLNNTELTAATFIPNGFSNVQGSRLYDTKERARYRFDGTIECLGQIAELITVPEESWLGEPKPFLAPRDLLEYQLVGIWEEILTLDVVGVTDNFFELGGSSLLALRLISQIEIRMGQSVPLVLFFKEPTIEHLADTLRLQAKEGTSPLVPIQPKGAKSPFFCVHSIDGQVIWYFELARRLGPDQPFYALRDVGTNGSEANKSVQEMAATYVEAIQATQAAGPYLLGGWSSGGVIAFEMAQQLQARGHEVGMLALFDTACPYGATELDEVAVFESIARAFVNGSAQKLSLSSFDFEDLDLDEKLELLAERARAANLLPVGTNGSYYRNALNTLTNNTVAIMRYAPQVYSGRTVLLRVSDNREPDLGWQRVISSGFEIQPVGGSHETMVSTPHVESLAAVLSASINDSQALF